MAFSLGSLAICGRPRSWNEGLARPPASLAGPVPSHADNAEPRCKNSGCPPGRQPPYCESSSLESQLKGGSAALFLVPSWAFGGVNARRTPFRHGRSRPAANPGLDGSLSA
jgi:hypothetical protein